ncbi:MAG: hypothetical protein B7Z45_06120 [Azorhizobium sp. 12-66-6]|nr:MAG: hypothetical protein B7Z45_06120 [Azorhizobium sp. 12-66-6]
MPHTALSQTQKNQEAAIAFGIILDVLMLIPYTITAVATGSVSILSELLRGALLLITEMLGLYTLRCVHRKKVGGFDCIVGALLLLASAFIVFRIATKHVGGEPPTALGVLAMIAVLANLFSNAAPLLALWRAGKGELSVIVVAQLRARVAKSFGSLTVVVCVAIDVFAENRTLALAADLVGGAIGAGFMIVIGVGLMREALPDLLDQALGEPIQLAVNQTLARHFEAYEGLDSVRTRRAGNVRHIEIQMRFLPDQSMGRVTDLIDQMTQDLQQAIPGADVVIVARASSVPAPVRPPASHENAS